MAGQAERQEVVIIGAGPAGLACAAALKTRGRAALVLERAGDVGSAWRAHYDRLHLHTHRMHSGLPGPPMPRDYPKYPSRAQVVAYLESYARHHRLAIRFGETVRAVTPAESGSQARWRVESDHAVYAADHVVIATGLANRPVEPDWPGRASFPGQILHSSAFRTIAALQARRVLVVGFGNSGGEIALEAAEAGLETYLSVRGPVNVIPKELLGLPMSGVAILQQRLPARLVDALNAAVQRASFGDLRRYGLTPAREDPMAQVKGAGRAPLIDVGTMRMMRDGRIRVVSGLTRSDGATVCFADGAQAEFDAIVLATGYDPALERLLPDCEARFGSSLRPPRGEVASGDGLYFCGLNAAPTGQLREIGIETRAIARGVDGADAARRSARRPFARPRGAYMIAL